MKPIVALILVVGITILCGVFAYRQLSALRAPVAIPKRSPQKVRRAQGSHVLSKESELGIDRKPSVNVPSLIPSAVPASLLPDTAKVLPIKMEVLSWSPRILLIDNLLSYEECDHMRNLAEPMMAKSTVVDVGTGNSIASSVRTSTGAFLNKAADDVVSRVEKRLAHVTMLPVDNGEAMQILRYEIGQYYRPHHDFFADEFNKKRGGQRTATVLMYLNDPEEGGETVFPSAGPAGSKCRCGGKESRGMSVQAKKGRAVVFWALTPEGKEDSKSLHGSCDVVKGSKWSATKWIRTGKFV